MLIPVKRFDVPQICSDRAKPDESMADLGLTSSQMAQQVLAAFFSQKQPSAVA